MTAKSRSSKYPLWRSRNYRWTVGPKVDLPAARYLGEIACCNHVGSLAIAIELTLVVDKETIRVGPMHPSCCQARWARAIYYSAMRKLIRSSIIDGELRKLAFQRLLDKVSDAIPLPDPSDFYDLGGAKRLERQRRKETKAGEDLRRKQLYAFLDSHPKIAPCFQAMGFDEVPTLEELRARFLALSLELHPDTSDRTPDAFKRLRQAYEEAMDLLNEQ